VKRKNLHLQETQHNYHNENHTRKNGCDNTGIISVPLQQKYVTMLLNSMKNRRSVRKYADRSVSDSLLNELFEVAARASNTGNMQLYSVVVTRDKANKEKQAPLHFNQKMATEAPVVLTFCADANRFVKWAANRKAEAGFNNLQTFIAATIDAMLFAQAFCYAAEARGLGICFLGTTAYNADKFIKEFKLPRLVVPVVAVTAGYPAEPLPPHTERLPLAAIVHKEEYADFTPESINALYKDKEELEVNIQYVKENNKETLAQVFTDVRYTKQNNEYFSDVFLQVLKDQGFLQ
jgi:nitroreductase